MPFDSGCAMPMSSPPSTARLNEALRQIFEAKVDHLPAYRVGRSRAAALSAESVPDGRPTRRASKAYGTGALRPIRESIWGRVREHCAGRPKSAASTRGRLPETVTVRRRGGGEILKTGVKARSQSGSTCASRRGARPWDARRAASGVRGDALIAVADLWMDAPLARGSVRGGIRRRRGGGPDCCLSGLSQGSCSANLNSRRIPIVHLA